ncbi:MAG: TVP38/TMEM64 family protein [Syntrophomonadaceae bacterium]|nr:TVP38/TMEM64 family protein [Syntrophomonadaceae bacterium]
MDFSTVNEAIQYIRSFGPWAPLVAFVLFFIQAALPVFPFIILAGAAGVIFGFWEGFALAWIGSLAGACFAFFLVRMTGWEWLHAKIQRFFKMDLNEVTPLIGFWGILIARIFPVVPTPLINFVSGISGLSFGIFLSASALGKIPFSLIYTGLGNHLRVSEDIITTAAALAVILLISFLGFRYVKIRMGASKQPPNH